MAQLHLHRFVGARRNDELIGTGLKLNTEWNKARLPKIKQYFYGTFKLATKSIVFTSKRDVDLQQNVGLLHTAFVSPGTGGEHCEVQIQTYADDVVLFEILISQFEGSRSFKR